MNFRRLVIAGLCWLAAACGKIEAGGAGFNEDCARNSDCAQPFYCKGGHCVLDAATICQAGKKRCNGDAVETCADGGDRWEVTKDCPTGCSNADCRPQACPPNERKCDGSMIFQCLSNGSGYVFVQSCPTTCNESTKECATPTCEPFATRCKPESPGTLQTCNSRGTAWVDEPCSATAGEAVCVEGRCLRKVCSVSKDSVTGAVTTREERCRGTVAESCNDTETGFDVKEVCGNGCDFDTANKKASCPPSACTPFDTRCKDRGVLETCNPRGTGWVETACDAEAQRCVAGACIPKVCSVTLASGGTPDRQERCLGNVREECDDTETRWRTIQTCDYGCQLDGTNTTCLPAACNAGDMKCDGLALLKCTPDRGSYGFVQYCPSGCVADATASPKVASCAAPVCPPLSRRCGVESGTGASFVEVCKADGTGYDRVENCPQACTAGVCEVNDSTCLDGDIRCRGFEVEQCVRLASGSSEWRFVERCLGQCNSGVCGGTRGSVGCEGGIASASTPTCGSQQQPFQVAPVLADPLNDKVPCDGVSRVMMATSKIVSSSGVPVPDGTLVTFVHDAPADAPDNLLASSDADPATPGLQRPTINGVATVVLSAPAATDAAGVPTACADVSAGATPTPRVVTVTASLGGRAASTGAVTFASERYVSTTDGKDGKPVYVAEDFSTTRYMDRVITTTAWNTQLGAAVALPSFDLGTGTDGELVVSTDLNLQSVGYARTWNVQALSSGDATVDSVLPALSPGDEVLLSTIWATSGNNMGNYEFKRVASVASGRILFTEPVRNTYGSANGFDSAQRTVIQRVPNFTAVRIAATGSLTSTAPTAATAAAPTGGTGILAMRVRGILSIAGKIDMKGKGFPAYPAWNSATAYNTPGTIVESGGVAYIVASASAANVNRAPASNPSYWTALTYPPNTSALARLFPGYAATGSNGGAIFLAAGTVSFRDSTGAYAAATSVITAEAATATGMGGTMWTQGGSFELNDPAASRFTVPAIGPTPAAMNGTSTRFRNSTGGRSRADYGAIDATTGYTGAYPAGTADASKITAASSECVYGGVGVLGTSVAAPNTGSCTGNNGSGGANACTSQSPYCITSGPDVGRCAPVTYICNGAPGWTGGTAFVGQGGAFATQSLVTYQEVSAAEAKWVDLIGAVGGSGTTTLALPISDTSKLDQQIPGLAVEVNVDGRATASPAPTWCDLNAGVCEFRNSNPNFPQQGGQFRWRAHSSTLTDKPLYLRGLAFKLYFK